MTACSTFSGSDRDENSYHGAKSPQKQLQCMAEAIHGEARGESEEGKIFVGRVVITRVQQGYGPNYCSVVYAKRQFAPMRSPSKKAIKAAVKADKLGPNGVTHFHSYKKQKTSLAGFSRSPQCLSKGKIGGHWGFTCYPGRVPASIKSAQID